MIIVLSEKEEMSHRYVEYAATSHQSSQKT